MVIHGKTCDIMVMHGKTCDMMVKQGKNMWYDGDAW